MVPHLIFLSDEFHYVKLVGDQVGNQVSDKL